MALPTPQVKVYTEVHDCSKPLLDGGILLSVHGYYARREAKTASAGPLSAFTHPCAAMLEDIVRVRHANNPRPRPPSGTVIQNEIGDWRR